MLMIPLAALSDLYAYGLLLAGLALMTIIMLRRWHRYYGPRTRGQKDVSALGSRPPSRDDPPRSLSNAPPDVLRWQVEMHDTARDLKAELDSKITVLQVLVRQAREEADRLEALLARQEHDRHPDRGSDTP